jgi:hypothetical protein
MNYGNRLCVLLFHTRYLEAYLQHIYIYSGIAAAFFVHSFQIVVVSLSDKMLALIKSIEFWEK